MGSQYWRTFEGTEKHHAFRFYSRALAFWFVFLFCSHPCRFTATFESHRIWISTCSKPAFFVLSLTGMQSSFLRNTYTTYHIHVIPLSADLFQLLKTLFSLYLPRRLLWQVVNAQPRSHWTASHWRQRCLSRRLFAGGRAHLVLPA